MHADLLLLGGRIFVRSRQWGSALAAAGDRIIAVGQDADLLALRGPRTRVVDLRGRLALPGFTDSHVHLGSLALGLSRIRLDSASSLREALRLVRRRVRATPQGAWITGGGFDKNRWGTDSPTRQDLDSVSPDHPVALRSRDGHSLWANSLALRKCGISARTRTPPGGRIARDEEGRPSGLLQEAAVALVFDSPGFEAPALTAQDLTAALRLLLRHGITSAHLMEETPLFPSLQALRQELKLPVRVTLYRWLAALDELIAADVHSGLGDEWLRFGGVKLFADGSLGSQTAWLLRPYDNRPARDCGVAAMPIEELRAHVKRAAEARIACAIHAIGDRANAEALDALAEARPARPPLPHRVEHCQLLRPDDARRFSQLGVVASMQPCHILGDIDAAERYWGRRCRHAYPLKSLLSSGATLAFGSDAPVETPNPLAGMYAAVERRTADGRPAAGWYRREQGISALQAISAYTEGPALATGESHLKGRLEPGYLADVAVLSKDITRKRGRALLDARVDLVIAGGRVRYRRRSQA